MSLWNILVLVLSVYMVMYSSAEECQVAPKCTCTFGSDSVDVEEQVAGSEALAGAVGALGSALLTGGGFSIWYLLKGRGGTPELEDDEVAPPVKRTNGPPEYSKSPGQVTAKNVYQAGINDNLIHKVSRNPAPPAPNAADF